MIQFPSKLVLLAKLFLVSLVLCSATSIKLEDIAESCPGNFITQDYNDSWENAAQFGENVPYYLPFASKYNAYVLTQNLFQTRDFEKLSEYHLENSCLTMKKLDGWGLVNVTGYHARGLPVRLVRTDVPKLFRFFLPYPEGGVGGYASIALSDNESYNLFDYCFDNGLRSFVVVSYTKTLDDTKLEVIKAHVKSLGYLEKNFIHLRYDQCLDHDTADLPKPAQQPTVLLQNFFLVPPKVGFRGYFYKKK